MRLTYVSFVIAPILLHGQMQHVVHSLCTILGISA